MDELLILRETLVSDLKLVKKKLNKSAFNEYHKNYQKSLYQQNPEFAERKRKQNLEKYHSNISETERQRRCAYAKAYYERKKLEKNKVASAPVI
jgi:hypothetical protein